MAGISNIEWTEHTWNPIVGCSIVSPGCTNCYAMAMAHRINQMTLSSHYEDVTKKVNGRAVWTGKITRANDYIFTAPLRRKKPTIYFVNSMGDLFHESIPDKDIDDVFAVMALSPQHTFQVLTKRAERMREYFNRAHSAGNVNAWQPRVCQAVDDLVPLRTDQSREAKINVIGRPCLPNVWLGVSAERQQEADERIPLLLQTPAAVRFVSAEPLLGPIAVWPYIGKLGWQMSPGDVRAVDWIITGGESGPHARPMNPQWARDIRDQCAAAHTAFFHKQNGEFVSVSEVEGAGAHHSFPDGRTVRRVGKKAADRLLDGVEHNEFPIRARSAGSLPLTIAGNEPGGRAGAVST